MNVVIAMSEGLDPTNDDCFLTVRLLELLDLSGDVRHVRNTGRHTTLTEEDINCMTIRELLEHLDVEVKI
jgi:hypothetical protein